MSTAKINTLHTLDEVAVSGFHWRMVFTAGMGFFTDAYDLFIIGVVTALLAPLWHLSIEQLAWLNGASLAAAAFGAVFFGKMADIFGRKRMYGFEIMILFFGALLSAVSPNFICLLLARILVGFGIGGDYPTSAVIASENANRQNRGYLVLLVFAMQALGLIVGPLIATLFLATGMSHELTWRLLLGLGALPAASVFYLRRRIQETPHYLLAKKAPHEVSSVISELTGRGQPLIHSTFKKQSLFSARWLKCLLITGGSWFLLDVAFYGNGISSMMILKHLNPGGDVLKHTVLSMLIFLVFAVPGYIVAAKTIDKLGRRFVQTLGFGMMVLMYGLIALMPAITGILPLFLLMFGLSFFFVNFGPNATTFLVPSEIYPTSIRAQAHGLSAAIGKVGAFIGAFFLPFVLRSQGLHFTLGLMALVALLGFGLSRFLPEMKQVSLEATEEWDRRELMV